GCGGRVAAGATSGTRPVRLPAAAAVRAIRLASRLLRVSLLASTTTGWMEDDDAPGGIRTRATALKGPRPGPLVDGGGRARIAAWCRYPRSASALVSAHVARIRRRPGD